MATPSPDLSQRARDLVQQDLDAIETMLDKGMRQAAAAALRTLLRRISPEQAAGILERGAVAELAREQGWEPPRRKEVWVPASRVENRQGEPLRLTREDLDRRRAQRSGDAAAATYLAEQDPAPVEQSGRDEPVWGTLDYDLAALPDLHGPGCLCCRLERTRTDLANPDGLCGECRDSGLTREVVIGRYCDLVAQRNPGDRAAGLLRQAWNRATRPADRQLVIERYCDLVAERNPGQRATDLLRETWARSTHPDRAVIAAWVTRQADRLPDAATAANLAPSSTGVSAAARASAVFTPARKGLPAPSRGRATRPAVPTPPPAVHQRPRRR
jgi:hypothetical protein